jgi:FixJ family two-component response regulator
MMRQLLEIVSNKIMLTGASDIKIMMNGFKTASLDRYLIKPWNSESLQAIVEQGLQTYFKVKNWQKLLDESI